MALFTGLLYLLLVAYIILLLVYRRGWNNIPGYRAGNTAPTTTITIIIPARNEERSLGKLLSSLQAQSYPEALLEIIVINDFSTDRTVLEAQRFPRVRVLHMRDFVAEGSINSYKKKAIEIGISHSSGQLIVTTDADCIAEPGWLHTLADFYETHHPPLVVMPVAIAGGNKMIEIFQRLDFLSLQAVTGAAVSQQHLNMCNGANLAYTREAFNAVNGFAGIDAIASGDDMLLMHKIAGKYPGEIKYLKSPEVIVQTEPVHSLGAFLRQRIRWASKADKYNDRRIFLVLLMVYLLNVFLLFIPVYAGIKSWFTVSGNNATSSLLSAWVWALIIKTGVEMYFIYPAAKFFKQVYWLRFFPLAQPFHIVYTVMAGWLGKFGSYKWKGRKVR